MRQGVLKKCICGLITLAIWKYSFCWGFFAHRKINYYAVFLLPPEMLVLYKPNIAFLEEHAVDPDKRRYMVKVEGPRHYLDIDHYGSFPFPNLPRKWKEAVEKYSVDTLNAHGIVPWWIEVMIGRLTKAFKDHDQSRILKLSAELGHYIADAHVPLHVNSNHNGQLTGQTGIHGFWESRVPELLADKDWNFFLPRAEYLKDPLSFIWKRVLESSVASDSVLRFERSLNSKYGADRKYAFEERNGKIVKQYSTGYTLAYDRMLGDMVERRMRQSVFAVASCWFTAWVNAGQPDLKKLENRSLSEADQKLFDSLNIAWMKGQVKGRPHE